MYKVMLSWFVIVSCFVFFVKGEDEVTQAPATQTDCDKFLNNCTECLANTLNCTFCIFPNGGGVCINLTVCKEQDTPVQNKSKCPEVPVAPTTVSTPDTPTTVTVPVPVTPKTESPTEASSSDASESTTTTSKPSPAPSGRHFDPPSFIGGTVLSLGLLAIVYVGFKFYKARTERNYHTL